jgi:DNA-directed RNA polymerase specialized sigma24 family protein
MTYEQARPIVERRLTAYYDMVAGPVCATSDWSGMPHGSAASSVQERWVLAREASWDDVALIERIMQVLGRREQALILMRYRDKKTWQDVADGLGVRSKREVYSLRDRALYVFACHMGLLDDKCNRTSQGK